MHPVYLTRGARREPIIISDAVYTRCRAIRHDKSLTVNCLVLFMTCWHKVQMSSRQTQPVVLRRSVRFRHGSLFLHQASGRVNSLSARALCGIGIAAYVATFLVGIFHLPLSRLYLASLEKASPIQTWPAGRLRSRELEDTCTNIDRHLYQGGILISRGGGHKSRCVCVCAICDRVQLLTLAKVQSLSYVRCFIGFTFTFKIDHVQQGGERKVGGTVTRLQQGPSLITK